MTKEQFFATRNIKNFTAVSQAYLTLETATSFASSHTSDSITLENIVFERLLLCRGQFDKRLIFKSCYFSKGIFVNGCTFEKGVYFDLCYFGDSLVFDKHVEFRDSLMIIGGVAKVVDFQGGKYQGCTLSFKAVEQIYFNGGEYTDARVSCYDDSPVIDKITMQASSMKGFIRILGKETKIYFLSVTGGSEALELSVEDAQVHSIYFFRYYGKSLKLFNIKPTVLHYPSEFFLLDSNFGKAEFYSIQLDRYTLVNIIDCYLIDSILIGVTWPKKLHYMGYGFFSPKDSEERKHYDQFYELYSELKKENGERFSPEVETFLFYRGQLSKVKETYRQLKYAYSKQGDFFQEHRFHVLEMNTLKRLFHWKKNGLQILIIDFSYRFSEFGQSLKRPVLGLFLVHWFFFLLVIATGFYPHLSLMGRFTEAGLSEAVFYYFKLINPLRSFDENIKGYLIILDLSMRIWSSAMLYNIIRATRRFIK
jgi:hypothetical protein